jgi:hypothetical protein
MRAMYIKEMKIFYYNKVWPVRRMPNSPTRYYRKYDLGWTNVIVLLLAK